MKKVFIVPGLLLAVMLLAGCGKPRLDLSVASMPNVNPDNSDRPSPIAVKTYELRSDLAFRQADFQSLFERPVPTLGPDIIAADEFVLVPGEARKVAYRPSPNTLYLGIVAGFRQMDRAHWRAVKAIDPDDKNIIALEFNDTAILVIPDDQAKNWDPEKAVKEFQQQTARPAARGDGTAGGANDANAPPANSHAANDGDGVWLNAPSDKPRPEQGNGGVSGAGEPAQPAQSASPVRVMQPL